MEPRGVLPVLAPGPLGHLHGLGGVTSTLKGRHDEDLCPDSKAVSVRGVGKRKVDFIVPVVSAVLHGQKAVMEIEKRDPAGKGESGTGRGNNADLARQPAVGTLSGKAHVHQRSWPDISQGRGSLSVADARLLVNGKAHGNGVDSVTQGEFVVLEVHQDDLA